MTRILIVDDMAIFREPLAATLRQEGFNTLTATNGNEALHIVGETPPDIILLDAAMPVMDGLTFLQRMRGDEKLMKIPILMLTAITDRNVVQRAAQLGIHDYLLKTQFTTQELLGRISKALGSTPTRESRQANTPTNPPANQRSRPTAKPPAGENSELQPLTLDQTLAHIRAYVQLRSIRPVLQHVLSLTRSAQSSFDDIARAIRQDQALAIKVMKVANSSFYRTNRPATTLRDAEQRIGLSGICNVTTAILAIEQFSEANPAGIIPQRFWEHSLATGMLAQRIGEIADIPKADDLFLAGLLHDVGRLVLSDVLPQHYLHVMKQFQHGQRSLCDIEREQFQLTHVDVTREVLMQWKMPAGIIEAAILHHCALSPMRRTAKHPRAAMALSLGNRLSHALMLGDSGSESLERFDELVSILAINQRSMRKLAESAVKRILEVTLFYGTYSHTCTLPPIADELRSHALNSPRVWVSENPPGGLQSILLMLGQLGWINHDSPNVALVGGDDADLVARQLRGVEPIEERTHTALPVVWISTTPHDPEELQRPRVAQLTLPCRRTNILTALRQAAQPQVLQQA